MAPIEVVHGRLVDETAFHPSASCRASGEMTATLVSPVGWSLWAVTVEMAEGASIAWRDDHGDEAVYVVKGALESEQGVCPEHGTFVVEAGIHAAVRATEPTTIVHFGPSDIAPPTDGFYGPPTRGVCTHIVGPGGVHGLRDDVSETRYFADATCDSCRVMIFYVARSDDYVSSGHSHSQDELIHVLHGEISVGRRRVGPGDTVAIKANTRYAFRSGPDGFGFLNYRRDVSLQTIGRDQPARLEGGAAFALPFVGDVIA